MTDAKTTTTELEKVQRMRMDSLSGMLVPAGTDWRNVGPKRWIRYEEAMNAAASDQAAAVKAAVNAAYMESARMSKRIAELERAWKAEQSRADANATAMFAAQAGLAKAREERLGMERELAGKAEVIESLERYRAGASELIVRMNKDLVSVEKAINDIGAQIANDEANCEGIADAAARIIREQKAELDEFSAKLSTHEALVAERGRINDAVAGRERPGETLADAAVRLIECQDQRQERTALVVSEELVAESKRMLEETEGRTGRGGFAHALARAVLAADGKLQNTQGKR